MARNSLGVAGDETIRSFPGFAPDRGFFSSLGFDDGWNATISQTEMAGLVGVRSQRDRFGEAVKLIEGKLSLIAEHDQPPDYVAISSPTRCSGGVASQTTSTRLMVLSTGISAGRSRPWP